MCSILAILDPRGDAAELRARALRLSRLQRHRGPDWSGIWSSDRAVLAHERLAIVDVTHGAQPLLNAQGTHVLAVNGEIYNHRELRAALDGGYAFQTESDCEVILALYREHGADFLDRLNGIFAFVLYDAEADRYLVGRDHLGIVPLYTGRDEHGNLYVASEMKALVPVCRASRSSRRGTCWTARRAWRGAGTGASGGTTTGSAGARPPPRRCARRWRRRCTAS